MDDQEAGKRFLLMIEEFRLAAWVGLGKLKDPHSGEARRNLELARHAIDTLGMLEVKTRNNRSEEEDRFLRQALADLRINYVDEVRAGEREQREGATAMSGATQASAAASEAGSGEKVVSGDKATSGEKATSEGKAAPEEKAASTE